MNQGAYCLLTACRNESNFIGEALRSVIGQSTRPRTWLILDDGSSDGTPEVIEEQRRQHPWIRLHRLEARRERSFGAQYRAIMRGYEMIRHETFDFIGALDADISFESTDYYRTLLSEFSQRPKMGVGGGVICENSKGTFKERKGNVAWSVAGGVQMFRREVFDAIGGYKPLEYGGSDGLAVLMARMHGWEAISFPGLRVLHHRPTSSADGLLRGGFRKGLMDAAFGYHPLFMVFKCFRRLTFAPPVLGSVLLMAGYWSYRLKGGKPVIPVDALQYLRQTQLSRLSRTVRMQGCSEV